MAHQMNVPEGEEGILQFIARLSQADFETLEFAFSDTRPTLYTTRFIREVISRIGPNEDPQWGDAVRSLIAIANAEDHFSLSSDRIAKDLSEDLRSRALLSDEESNTLRIRLEHILSLKNLEISIQADRALTNRGNLFSSASISTQIQPLFVSKNGEPTFSTAIFSHELQFQVYETSDRTTILRLVLDDADLHQLRVEIDRAILRCKALKSSVQENPITFLNDGSERE